MTVSNRTHRRGVVFSAVLLSVPLFWALPACDGGSGADTNADALLVNELANRTFISQKVEEGGALHELVAGTELSLSFHQDRRIGAAAGCNSGGGEFRVVDDALIIDEMGTTEMGCEQQLHDQDDWYFGFLGTSPIITVDGDALVLDNGSIHIAYLDREVVVPDQNLVGPKWVVDTIIEGDAAINADWQDPATLVFGDDGTVDVFSGCNDGDAGYQVNGAAIAFGPLVLTEMACPNEMMQQLEDAVRTVVHQQQQVAWEIDANRLDLNIEGYGLSLVAAPN
jgi:heat shock protein HslJ